MARTVLAVDSGYEPVTQAGFSYRQQYLYPALEQSGMMLIRCQGMLARRDYFEPEARKQEVGYVTGVGHGEADKYKGDFNNEIMVVGQYDAEEVRGKIYHFVSCQTAKALGPDAIRKGCRAYFGYDQDFAFCPEHADVFFQCDSQIDLALAQGRTAGDAHQQAIDKYNDYIAAFMAAGDSITAAALEFNRDHLCSPVIDPRWGDSDARL